MDDKTRLSENLKETEASVPLKERIITIFKQNWLAFVCALAIALLTIIVVPIVYSLDKSIEKSNTTNLSWDVNGNTIINQNTSINNYPNISIGFISAIFIDQNDTLYILDQTNHRLLKNQLQTNFLELIIGNSDGTNGTNSAYLNSPSDVFVDSSSNIYLADTLNHRIQHFYQTNQGQTIFGTGQSVKETTSITGLDQPKSITIDQDSTLFIADYGNNRIISIHLINRQLNVVVPSFASQRNQYIVTPISIKYSSISNSLLIAQQTGFNVVRWKLNGTYWKLIAGSASSELSGTSRTLFNEICSINVDIYDSTYVNDCLNSRIQYYKKDFVKGKTIAGVIQASGNNSFLFNRPNSIALDSNKNLYVADSNNFRIQKFTQLF